MEKKRLCLVVPSLRAGGMERVIIELANYFSQKEDIELHLISLIKGQKFFSVLDKINFHEPLFSFNPRKRFFHQAKTIIFLRNKLKRIEPVSVLSFGETYNSFVLLATMLLKIKVFVSDRSKPDKRWGFFQEHLRKLLYPLAYGIISQTSYSKFFLAKEIRHKNIKVIPNPIVLSKSPKLPRENVIINVGRLIYTKRIDLLLEIFAGNNDKNWQLWIIGDGPLKVELEEKAVNLGVSKEVKFWGYQKEIEWFYSKSKVFAFTSFSEGFPNALLEAIEAGLPTIAFDCTAGPSDLIEDGVNGFLIPLGKVEIYQKKLKELLDNEILQQTFGANAKKLSEKYEMSKIGEEYLNFLLS